MTRRSSSTIVVPALALMLGVSLQPAGPAAGQKGGGGWSRGGGAEQRIGRVLDRVESAEAKRKRLRAELDGLGKRREAARKRLRKRARALYRITRSGMLPVAGGLSALLGHVGRVERLERMVADDLEALQSLKERTAALKTEADRLSGRLREAKRELRSLRKRRGRGVEPESEKAFRDALSESRFESEGGWRRMDSGGYRVADDGAGRGFESKRGELAMPVSGTFEARQARRDGAQGMEFVVSADAKVRAVAEGRVAFADRHAPYGRLIIVDHGDDYYTVYGGLGRIDAQLGDYVGRGARLGTVRTESEPHALFFEVRRGTRSVDPRPWLGLF